MMYRSLFEQKSVGILYHFTSLNSLPRILKQGFLKGNKHTAAEMSFYFKTFSKIIDQTEDLYSYSFTRKRDLKLLTSSPLDIDQYTVRITFDGNRMSDKYSFFPISEINYTRNNNTSEAEERILSKDPTIPINKYILDVFIPFSFINKKYSFDYKQLIKECSKLSRLITIGE